MKILKCSEIMVRKCLTALVNNGFLIRVERGEFLANPLTFYKGGTKSLKEKMKRFNKVKKDKRDFSMKNVIFGEVSTTYGKTEI